MATIFSDDIFKCIYYENVWISIKISLKCVIKGTIDNIPVLVQIMAWRRPSAKPLPEPMLVSSLTHICISRPHWVNQNPHTKWCFHNAVKFLQNPHNKHPKACMCLLRVFHIFTSQHWKLVISMGLYIHIYIYIYVMHTKTFFSIHKGFVRHIVSFHTCINDIVCNYLIHLIIMYIVIRTDNIHGHMIRIYLNHLPICLTNLSLVWRHIKKYSVKQNAQCVFIGDRALHLWIFCTGINCNFSQKISSCVCPVISF